MTTKDVFFSSTTSKLMSRANVQEQIFDYLDKGDRDRFRRVYSEDGFFDTSATIVMTAGNQFAIRGSDVGTDGDGRIIDISDRSMGILESPARDFFSGITYQNALGAQYDVALHAVSGPLFKDVNGRAAVVASTTGDAQYTAMREYVGEVATPSSAIDVGSGRTRLNIDTATEPGVSNSGRHALVYLRVPQATAESDAIKLVETQWDGTNNFVTFDNVHTGPLPTAVSFQVLVLGPTVRRNTNLREAEGYLFIGNIAGSGIDTTGVPDISDQEVFDSDLSELDIVDRLSDLTSFTGEAIPAFPGGARRDVMCVAEGVHVYAIGGNKLTYNEGSVSREGFSDSRRYNVSTNAWEDLPSVPSASAGGRGRSQAGIVSIPGAIFVVGGNGQLAGSALNSAPVDSAVTHVYLTELGVWRNGPTLPAPASGMAAVYDSDERNIYIMGGTGLGRSVLALDVSDFSADTADLGLSNWTSGIPGTNTPIQLPPSFSATGPYIYSGELAKAVYRDGQIIMITGHHYLPALGLPQRIGILPAVYSISSNTWSVPTGSRRSRPSYRFYEQTASNSASIHIINGVLVVMGASHYDRDNDAMAWRASMVLADPTNLEGGTKQIELDHPGLERAGYASVGNKLHAVCGVVASLDFTGAPGAVPLPNFSPDVNVDYFFAIDFSAVFLANNDQLGTIHSNLTPYLQRGDSAYSPSGLVTGNLPEYTIRDTSHLIRYMDAQADVIDGHIIVTGGSTMVASDDTAETAEAHLVYFDESDTWGRIARMPASLAGHSTFVYRNKLHAIFGVGPTGTPENPVTTIADRLPVLQNLNTSMYIWDAETNVWESQNNATNSREMVRASKGFVKDGIAYVVGNGYTDNNFGSLPQMFAFELINREMLAITYNSSARPRIGAATALIDDTIISFGGETAIDTDGIVTATSAQTSAIALSRAQTAAFSNSTTQMRNEFIGNTGVLLSRASAVTGYEGVYVIGGANFNDDNYTGRRVIYKYRPADFSKDTSLAPALTLDLDHPATGSRPGPGMATVYKDGFVYWFGGRIREDGINDTESRFHASNQARRTMVERDQAKKLPVRNFTQDATGESVSFGPGDIYGQFVYTSNQIMRADFVRVGKIL